MSARTAGELQKMLRGVMQKKGTGEKLDLPGYPVAGKTGTAQKVDPATRHYSSEFWASSFMGYAPFDDPRLLIFVLVDEPQEGHYGSEVAGPIFVKVMSAALPYLGVPPRAAAESAVALAPRNPGPPTEAPAPAVVAAQGVPNFIGLGLGRALELGQQAELRLEVTGSGLVVAQEPPPHSPRRSPVCELRLSPPP
jgi:cell division protein FtsI (penicillin-binding protein 3)